MTMRLIFSFTIFSVVSDMCWTESESRERISTTTVENDIIQLVKNIPVPDQEDMISPHLNILWTKRPLLQVPKVNIMDIANSKPRQPYTKTKIAKSLKDNLYPYFNRDNFEPFERRPKPITLVAFRKSGIYSREPIKTFSGSSEIAELQSPYNEISNFWANSPYD